MQTTPERRTILEACIVAIHRCKAGSLTLKGPEGFAGFGSGWVRYHRGRITGGNCTGLPEYLLMRAHWEQTGF
jgi:hypothetical protein